MTKELTPLRFDDLRKDRGNAPLFDEKKKYITIQTFLHETNTPAYMLRDALIRDSNQLLGMIVDVHESLFTNKPVYNIATFGARGRWWTEGEGCHLILEGGQDA